jgi:hypothetical protein
MVGVPRGVLQRGRPNFPGAMMRHRAIAGRQATCPPKSADTTGWALKRVLEMVRLALAERVVSDLAFARQCRPKFHVTLTN